MKNKKKKAFIFFVVGAICFEVNGCSWVRRSYSTSSKNNGQKPFFYGSLRNKMKMWDDFFNPKLPTLAQPPVPRLSEEKIREYIKHHNRSLLSDAIQQQEGFKDPNDLKELNRLNTVLSNVLLEQQQKESSKDSVFANSKKTDTDGTRNE